MNPIIMIQDELKAPKTQFNSFGNYYYRNCEDILEAVKPLLKKYKCYLTITDEIVLIGTRFYIKATATLFDENDKELGKTSAFAREPEAVKGQSDAQITGSSSSYARKYALNGLFDIDDTKDSDTTNTGDKTAKEKPTESASNSTVSNAQPPKPTAQASGTMTLEQAKAFYFSGGKHANEPFGTLKDDYLTWVSQNGNGKAKTAADIILKSRTETKQYQQSLIEDTEDNDIPF